MSALQTHLFGLRGGTLERWKRFLQLGLWRVLARTMYRNVRGQDMIEYALMAGFVAVAAAAVMPGPSAGISTVFSRVSSVLSATPGG